LINNRQGGRRRGRGGQRQNLGGQPGNRQDNRQRGNAAQLLEKYKSLARDAQLAGDRVQTEYYLQYADHYFRVLCESRARFEEQNPRRQRDDADEDEGDEELVEAGDEQGSDEEREPRRERFNRNDRGRDRDRGRRYGRDERNEDGDGERDSGPRLNGGDALPLDVLPPAIGADAPAASLAADDAEPAEEERRPRRSRRPRAADGDDDVAPAV
jgi:hypothetical protein